MGHRLSKIYTRTGDGGTTGLADGQRVAKHDLRVEAFGTIDELNSQLGLLIAHGIPSNVLNPLRRIQHELFDLGSELCMPGYKVLCDEHVKALESWLDGYNRDLPPLKEFILPGGSLAASQCHVVRTVCRRAERICSELLDTQSISAVSLAYLNRLSDLLFVVARVLARLDQGSEILWQPNQEPCSNPN